jgi:hypothetical protein
MAVAMAQRGRETGPLRACPEQPATAVGRAAPYIGLAAFRTEDSDLLFDKEAIIDSLVTRLTMQRFVAVFGASGEGKSSLLSAGLIPKFADDGPPWSPADCLGSLRRHPIAGCSTIWVSRQ